MQNTIRQLMSPDDMLETFSELAVKEPDLMRIVLQATVTSLVNVQTVEAAIAELKRRAPGGNSRGSQFSTSRGSPVVA